MTNSLAWETDMQKALTAARMQGRQILLDFFNPG